MTDPTHKTYLGNGVYVELSPDKEEMVLLWEFTRIALGPAETAALLLWLKQRNDEVEETT